MSSPQPDERVLIVDDEDQIRTLLARLLGAQGYECISAESAAAARRVLKEIPVALVLSDVNMPGESGIDLTREVLAHYPETAVVMVTGMDDRSYAEIARAVGQPGAVRAVGTANGANPVAVLVPCHRVIRSDGSLGGYAGGLERKRKLLDAEGCRPSDLFGH